MGDKGGIVATTISVCNHKGGVGKTTTVINLSAALAEQGKKVLVVDLDPQGNSTMVLFGGDPYNSKTAIDLFISRENVFDDVYQPSKVKNVWIIPTNLRMMKIKSEVSSDIKAIAALKNKFTPSIQKEFDYILLDCPPDLGPFVNNALVISDYYLMPVSAEDKFGLKGLDDIITNAKEIREGVNSNLELLGILVTIFDARTVLGGMLKDVVTTQYKEMVFKTIINRNTDLSQANAKNKTVFQHDRRAPGAQDYLALAKEVIARVEERRIARRTHVDV